MLPDGDATPTEPTPDMPAEPPAAAEAKPAAPPRDFWAFAAAMRQRESSDNYAAITPSGSFTGAYQFGMPRLVDLGLAERKRGGFAWRNGFSLKRFLGDKGLQDRIFAEHVKRLCVYLMAQHGDLVGKDVQGVGRVTLSGLVAAAHLVGPGGVRRMLRGEDVRDGNGTAARQYLAEFADYDFAIQSTRRPYEDPEIG